MADTGEIVCPGCGGLLLARIGEVRRWHFAHRLATACRAGKVSPEVAEAQALLYLWLEGQYPDCVQLSTAPAGWRWDEVPHVLLNRPDGLQIAFLIFDRAQPEMVRWIMGRHLDGVHVHFLHTQRTLVIESDDSLLLSKSQREFITESSADLRCAGYGLGHLTFIHTDSGEMRVYRGLYRNHPPAHYSWRALRQGLLEEAWLCPITGEILLPGDELPIEKEPAPKVSPAVPEVILTSAKETPPGTNLGESCVPAPIAVPSATPVAPAGSWMTRPYVCRKCQRETTDWSDLDRSTGTCLCYACLGR